MATIKFSHKYEKLLDQRNVPITCARLLYADMVELDCLHESFIKYDTDCGMYKLPKKGTYILLLFEKPQMPHDRGRNLFTTLRRYTLEKLRYYGELIGKIVQIEYTEGGG